MNVIAHVRNPIRYLQLLLETRDSTGVDFKVKTDNNVTPLQLTICYKRDESFRFLVDNLPEDQLQLDAKPPKSQKINHHSVDPILIMLAGMGHEALVKLLVEKFGLGIVNVPNRLNKTALIAALEFKHTRTVDYLMDQMLRYGTPEEIKGFFNVRSEAYVRGSTVRLQTPLHVAIERQRIPHAGEFIANTDLTLRDSKQQTTLITLLNMITNLQRNQHVNDNVSHTRGTRVSMSKSKSRSIHEKKRRFEELAIQMIDKMKKEGNSFESYGGFSTNPFYRALQTECSHIVEALNNVKGIDVNQVDDDGNTPLMYAIRRNLKTVPSGIKMGGISFSVVNKNQRTALSLSQDYSPQYFNNLLSQSSKISFDINSFDKQGLSYILRAVKNNNIAEVQALLEYVPLKGSKPVNLFLANPDGETPLSLAVKKLRSKMVIVLVSNYRNLIHANGSFGRKYLKIVVSPEGEKDLERVISKLKTAITHLNKRGKSYRTSKTILQILTEAKTSPGIFTDKFCERVDDKQSCDNSYCEWAKGSCHSSSKAYLSKFDTQ
jgi:ankyrin repeat protein